MNLRIRKISEKERNELHNKYYIMVMSGKGGKATPAVLEEYDADMLFNKWIEVSIVEAYHE